MNRYIRIRKDALNAQKYAELAKESSTAFALYVYLLTNAEPAYKISITVATFDELKRFLGKSKDSVRRAIKTLIDKGFIVADGITSEKITFKNLI